MFAFPHALCNATQPRLGGACTKLKRLDPVILERLAALGIRLLTPDAKTHYLFARDGFVALVERRGDGVANIGSTGLWTDGGLAYLIWRQGRPFFVAKSAEIAAEESQVMALRRFSEDLAATLARGTSDALC